MLHVGMDRVVRFSLSNEELHRYLSQHGQRIFGKDLWPDGSAFSLHYNYLFDEEHETYGIDELVVRISRPEGHEPREIEVSLDLVKDDALIEKLGSAYGHGQALVVGRVDQTPIYVRHRNEPPTDLAELNALVRKVTTSEAHSPPTDLAELNAQRTVYWLEFIMDSKQEKLPNKPTEFGVRVWAEPDGPFPVEAAFLPEDLQDPAKVRRAIAELLAERVKIGLADPDWSLLDWKVINVEQGESGDPLVRPATNEELELVLKALTR